MLVAGLFAGTAGPATAEANAPAGKPVSLISYNVCGAWTCQSSAADEDAWVDQALQKVPDLGATDVILLQELCAGQYEKLVERLGAGYSGHFAAQKSHSGCDKWSTAAPPTTDSTRIGQAVILQTGAGVVGSSVQVTVGRDTRLAVCAKGPVSGRHTLACSVHLSVDTAQGDMGELLDHIEANAGGASVILGGDFNVQPDKLGAAVAAGRPVTGSLVEADAGRNTATAAWNSASSRYTAKLDYAFFSSEDFGSPSASVVDVGLAGIKDHALLKATAVTRAPVDGDLTGDGRPDLVAVRKDGTLRLYPGLGSGRFDSPRLIGSAGWLGAVVSHRGDWTGDGREDVMAQIGDNLWVYPNVGGGSLGKRVAIPNREAGWADKVPRAAGDLDGDGQSDLVVKSANGSALWLHRGGTPATGPSLPRAALSIGGSTDWADYDVLTPGNIAEDPTEGGDKNMADLWARDRITGELKQFRSMGAAGLAPPQVIGGDTWDAVQRPLAASLGDGNDDGHADLWVTTKYDATTATGGDLWFRPGTIGVFGTPARVGEGGWSYIDSLG